MYIRYLLGVYKEVTDDRIRALMMMITIIRIIIIIIIIVSVWSPCW